MNKVSFTKIFKVSMYQFKRAFELFDASLPKVLLYFVLINLIAFIPITYQILTIENIDYSRYGLDFHEELPEWLPKYLPQDCRIVDQTFLCDNDNVYDYVITNNETAYTIKMNVPDGTIIDDEHTIIFYRDGFNMNFTGNIVLRFTYSGFDNVYFSDLSDLEQEEAAEILFEGMFQSIKPTLVLPIIIFFVGGMMLMNLILLLTIAAISMMFRFNQSDFPSYKNMIKLMIFASTIPSIINLGLGFLTLGPFTSITYNLISPIIAFFMYRASRLELNEF